MIVELRELLEQVTELRNEWADEFDVRLQDLKDASLQSTKDIEKQRVSEASGVIKGFNEVIYIINKLNER